MIYLPLCYAAPTAYYYYLINFPCQIEIFANYQRQTLANRCYIASSNGIEALAVPVEKPNGKQIIKDVKIFNATNWQMLHWRAIESAYSSSAFFEYYKDEIFKFYSQKYTFLIDFNLGLQNKILEMLNYKNLNILLSEYYNKNIETGDLDLRGRFSAKNNFSEIENITQKPYYQVFMHKYGFKPNLSILDLLFNLGNEARIYLQA